MASHRFIAADQARRLLEVPEGVARAQLAGLEAAGFARRERPFRGAASFFLITQAGLRGVGSRLPAPRLALSCWEHDLGAAWLWLAAREGAFGSLQELVSEREMRSGDARRPPGSDPAGVRLGGHGSRGRERLHYPDLLLVSTRGRRVAIELELTAKGRSRREQILGGYGADVRIDSVLYLVPSRPLGQAIGRSARRMGMEGLVHVQMTAISAPGGGCRRAAAPTRVRGRAGARLER